MTNFARTQLPSIYRLYDQEGTLLYIGETGRGWPQRMREHMRDKPWFNKISRVELEMHPTKEAAARAEAEAIRAERPRHNIVYNFGSTPSYAPFVCSCECDATYADTTWVVTARQTGYARKSRLWLVPELCGDPVVDNVCDESGDEQLEYWVRYLLRNHENELLTDQVPIYWFIEGDAGIFEAAPLAQKHYGGSDMLDHFYWPYCSNFEHDDVLVDFFRLPVVMERWPALYQALGWRPSPLQPTIPLHSILRSKCHYLW
jgi:hypothetical protein